jgi:hypothetical protein
MGSRVYARTCREKGDQIEGALIFDALATYSPQPRAKRGRFFFLPELIGLPAASDYLAFMGNIASSALMRNAAKAFQRDSSINLRTVALPAISKKVAWSDDWSFWQEGYLAFTMTDTAYLRADHYHELTDTPDKLDYVTLAEVVDRTVVVIREWAQGTLSASS